MANRKLVFHEITDDKTQAVVNLDCGYSIQITFDKTEGMHDCNLYDNKGSIADSEQGLDLEGVEHFITNSETLVDLYKESALDGLIEA